MGHCTYPEGYFDVKYMTKDYITVAAEKASEPTRNSFVKARVLFSSDPEIEDIVALGRAAAEKQDDASIDAFVQAYFVWSKYPFPNFNKAYSRYVADFEQWWYVQRPNVNEW